MKYIITILFCAVFTYINAQIKLPVNFYLVKGQSPVGRDDYYTDGQYRLNIGTPFQGGEPDIEERKRLLSIAFGFNFNITKDGILYGTGVNNSNFKYVVIANGFSFVLTSKNNNKGFSNYSIWLLSEIRNSLRTKKRIYFEEDKL